MTKNLKRVYILIVLDIIFIKTKGGNNMKERFKWTWNELKETFFNVPLGQQIFILIELIILFSWSFGLVNGLLATFGFCIFSFLFMFIIIFISKED